MYERGTEIIDVQYSDPGWNVILWRDIICCCICDTSKHRSQYFRRRIHRKIEREISETRAVNANFEMLI